jgi:hypothetical protein
MPRYARPTKTLRQALTPAVAHFLSTSCYWAGDPASGPASGFSFACFLLACDLSQRRLGPLRLLWAAHGDTVRAQDGRGPIFVEVVLAGAAWRWPTRTPWRCVEHPDRRPGGTR